MRLIRGLSQVKPHKSHPKTYDTDHELFSHPLDALRYLLVNLPQASGEWTPSEPEPNFWARHQRIW